VPYRVPEGIPARPGRWFGWSEVWRVDGRTRTPPLEWWANAARLAVVLDVLRDAVGAPLRVTSWHRWPEQNAAIGGTDPTRQAAPTSRHQTAEAADVAPPLGWSSEELAAVAILLGLVRALDQLIWYDAGRGGHVHVGQWRDRRGGERHEVRRGLEGTTREVLEMPSAATLERVRVRLRARGYQL